MLFKKKFVTILVFIGFLFGGTSCHQKTAYSDFETLPLSGWCSDSIANFTFNIADTSQVYNVLVCIRHKKTYPYQNLWLFMETILPDSTAQQDTIECYLADQRGQWLGSGVGTLVEMPVLFQQNIQFSDTGKYTYCIQHGMRESVLKGINDVGISIEKAN